jgi:L-aspartate oxidase
VERYHSLKELAPRDVVARAIVSEMTRTGSPHVFLDITSRGESFIRERFPRIYQTCLLYGVNIATDPAPVAPAAHYAMGGVRTDLEGRTNVARLFAAGEAACTGVHGANRLASNSLLEGVVFGIRAGRTMREAPKGLDASVELRSMNAPVPAFAGKIQRIAWERCGIVRSGEGLRPAVEQLEALAPESSEERNMRQVALLIARCALARKESRGAHFRSDYPETCGAFARHSVVSQQTDVTFR